MSAFISRRKRGGRDKLSLKNDSKKIARAVDDADVGER